MPMSFGGGIGGSGMISHGRDYHNIQLVPIASETSPIEGDLYYDTTENRLYIYTD